MHCSLHENLFNMENFQKSLQETFLSMHTRWGAQCSSLHTTHDEREETQQSVAGKPETVNTGSIQTHRGTDPLSFLLSWVFWLHFPRSLRYVVCGSGGGG